ncbi:MAG: hypothetical protein GDA43_08980 [Hormoscilla sp. SP5CHS1]|nr:hypothetical protein [Hormoscilla sp. SP12CHS1]MBC6453328.1 hypothetical protein [Hormoscilla sp. SP5CHS1]
MADYNKIAIAPSLTPLRSLLRECRQHIKGNTRSLWTAKGIVECQK